MKRKLWTIILAAATAVLVAAAVFIWIGVLNIDNGPRITVYTEEGKEVNLLKQSGKPVVLNFWASWGGPCKSEMPAFEAAYQAQGKDIQFMMVNLTDGYSETQETASAFIDQMGYTFPVYFDLAGEANAAYQITAIPATYFIDKDGNVVASHVGAMDADTLQSYLDQIT